MQKKVDFGYSQVTPEEKKQLVRDVFDNVVDQYDLMNDLMSFGLHHIWKRILVEKASIRSGDVVLDLAAGTGDITVLAKKFVGEHGKIVSADISHKMLKISRDRLTNIGSFEDIDWCQCDAEKLPFPDNYFNRILISFGLRNVTHKENALSEMFRVTSKYGRVTILEFSKPKPGLRKIVANYNSMILPFLGEIITRNKEAYQYLAESIEVHPDQESLACMIKEAGFRNVEFSNISGGIVAVHLGQK